MKRRVIAAPAIAVLLAGLLLVACSDDPTEPPKPKPTPSPYEDLTEMWHPLNNLEIAYNRRDINKYKESLDNAYYRFFFAPGDVSTIAEYWTYLQDTQAATRMFDTQLPDMNVRAVKLEVALVFDKDNIQWTEFNPADPAGETWYETIVGLKYYIKLGDGREFAQSPGASARIVVRSDPSDSRWHVVQFYDLAASLQGLAPKELLNVETTSFGQIKALYIE